MANALAGFDPLAAGPASTAAQPSDPTTVQNRQDQKEAFQKAGTTETRNSGNLTLPADLEPGQWRWLTADDLALL